MPENIPTPPNPDHNSTPSPQEVAKVRRNAIFNWLIALVAFAVFALRFPSLTQTIVVFVIVLGILVFVHEWGHYQFGRWGGMKVNRFGIGFPPWVYTKRYKDIDYSIGALPIGGMVDIAGLGSEEEMVATAKREEDVLEQSQRTGRRDVPHGQKLFQDATLGWRFMTLFAGPLMNFLFAVLMFVGVFSIWGIIDGERSTILSRIADVRYGDPAHKAGIQAGDQIIGVNGVPTTDVTTISEQIESSGLRSAQAHSDAPAVSLRARFVYGAKPIEPVTMTLQRDKEVITKEVVPALIDKDFIRNTGVMDSRRAPGIGIEFSEELVFKKVGVGEAVKTGVLLSVGMTYQLLKVVGRALTFQLNEAERRNIGGPVRIAQAVGKASEGGPQQLLLFAGLLSVNLGMINLLPFPALDGGRILFLGYELVFRRPIDAKKETVIHMAGMVMLLAFMLFITVRDVLPWIERSLRSVF